MKQHPVAVIQLDQDVAVCHICGAESPPRWDTQIYAGYVLPNDWQGEWAGAKPCP